MKTAKKIKDLKNWNGEAALYQLSPPLKYSHRSFKKQKTTKYVVVSAVSAMFSGAETYIFPADSHGEVKSWGELNGSFRGSYDHERALNNAGYKIRRD